MVDPIADRRDALAQLLMEGKPRETIAGYARSQPGTTLFRSPRAEPARSLLQEPPPPLPNVPDTPGKVPPTHDPRTGPAVFEAVDLASNFIPFGMLPRTAKVAGRLAPEAEMLASRSASLYNPRHRKRRVRSRKIILPERPPMPPEDCSPTSKEDRSSPSTSPVAAWWVEAMKPSRRRNLTPSQRAQLARFLRALRRERYHGDLSAYTESCAERVRRSAASAF